MAVRRIVANVATDEVSEAGAFYGEILGMQVAMDLGWIVTLKSDAAAAPQISIASEGGSGAAVAGEACVAVLEAAAETLGAGAAGAVGNTMGAGGAGGGAGGGSSTGTAISARPSARRRVSSTAPASLAPASMAGSRSKSTRPPESRAVNGESR